MFPFEDLVNENGLAEKPVLLSYRTQQMLLMALSEMEKRHKWQDMTDIEWDELDGYIAEAETEVLTISESEIVPILSEVTRITSTQAIATGGVLVQWNSGVSYDSGNPTMLVPALGHNVISASLNVSRATASGIALSVLKNGNEIHRVNRGSLVSHYIGCSFTDYVSEFDYYEVALYVDATSTLQIAYAPFLQALSVGG